MDTQASDSAAPPPTWKTYQIESVGVRFRLPPDFERLETDEHPMPGALLHAAFDRPVPTDSPLFGRTPAAFSLDVFANPERRHLDDWLREAGIRVLPGRRSLSPAAVAGRVGVQVSDSAQLAPNVFYYVAAGRFVYRFVPLGAVGEKILGSVSLHPPQ